MEFGIGYQAGQTNNLILELAHAIDLAMDSGGLIVASLTG
jgi:hypothetical protein